MPTKNSSVQILYVEDDESLGYVTRDNLELEGYHITHSIDGQQALDAIQQQHFDLYILDVMLPKIDGFTLAQEIRKKDKHTPIIFLTARSLKEDRIQGLKLGGDDYLTKPFSIEELILKIEVFLRRPKVSQPNEQDRYQLGAFEFEPNNYLLKHGEDNRQLTERESDLLQYFAQRPNEVLKRSDILISIWGEDDYFLGRSLDVFISRLRKYLKEDETIKLENIHGVGFKLVIGD